MPQKKSQIALEYMIVFSFVLVVFTLLFAEIAVQRVQVQNSQLFSDDQLIAQNIAAQLDRALQAGAGYSASVPLATAIGSVNFNLNITKNGAVVVSTPVGGQKVQAISYSSVKDVVSDPSFLSASGTYYAMPIANGSLWIQNSFGTVCVDYQCPAAGGQASALSLSSQVTHAANFNGQSSYVGASAQSLSTVTTVSASAWFKSLGTADAFVVSQYSSPCGGAVIYTSSSGALGQFCFSDSTYATAVSNVNTNDGAWHHAVATYDGSYVRFYLDGTLKATSSLASGKTIHFSPYGSYSYNLWIGDYLGISSFFNGGISNLQIYNTALSANQVQQLYQEGIAGTPVAPANVVGWWLLNGNANDYSGNGNNGNVIGPLTYTSVAQLFAKATNQLGYPLNGLLVGFTTTLGTFNGINQVATNYTNANGIATAFLSQQGNNGQALVKAVAYNGNSSLQGNLIGWWPLNLGQGSTAYDLSGNGNNGAMSYTSWSQPNYVAKFDGQSSSVVLSTSALVTGSQITMVVWAYQLGPGNVPNYPILMAQGTTSGAYLDACYYGTVMFSVVTTSTQALARGGTCTYGVWTQYVGTYDGSTTKLYINGVLVSSTALSGSLSYLGPVAVGAWPSGGNNFNGQLADAQIYNTALTTNQVQSLYQEGISSPPVTSSGLSRLVAAQRRRERLQRQRQQRRHLREPQLCKHVLDSKLKRQRHERVYWELQRPEQLYKRSERAFYVFYNCISVGKNK